VLDDASGQYEPLVHGMQSVILLLEVLVAVVYVPAGQLYGVIVPMGQKWPTVQPAVGAVM